MSFRQICGRQGQHYLITITENHDDDTLLRRQVQTLWKTGTRHIVEDKYETYCGRQVHTYIDIVEDKHRHCVYNIEMLVRGVFEE